MEVIKTIVDTYILYVIIVLITICVIFLTKIKE